MKILFAVNNDNISDAIVKKYQKEYNDILSYKNVYYFNAILRELQMDKSYSRIVISEDLEPFANNNYDAIDKFLFEKYSNIIQSAKGTNGENIPVILVCADRRKRTDNIIVKIYKCGIYGAIMGQDRSIDEICRLINSPRDKMEAKKYYNIQENELGDVESETSVSEAEVENIRAHYARLGKNEDKYVESFNNIVSQYSDTQLQIIIKYLPMNVKAVLEERSPKYQELALQMGQKSNLDVKRKATTNKAENKKKKKEMDNIVKEDEVIDQFIKPKNIKNVVVPSALKTEDVQKVVMPKAKTPEVSNKIVFEDKNDKTAEKPVEKSIEMSIQKPIEEPIERTIQKPVEEPLENAIVENDEIEFIEPIESISNEVVTEVKRGRGRPKKNIEENIEQKPKRGRGRPKKNAEQEEMFTEFDSDMKEINPIKEEPIQESSNDDDEFNLFEISEETNKNEEKNPNKQQIEEFDLFDLNAEEDEKETSKNEEFVAVEDIEEFEDTENDDEDTEEELDDEIDEEVDEEEEEVNLFEIEEEPEQEVDLFNTYEEDDPEVKTEEPVLNEKKANYDDNGNTNFMVNTNRSSSNINFSNLLTSDKKIVGFVGTTKNGTSFIVNNTAEMLSSMGINTAILDMTKTKNAYYIYTNNEENLREIAKNCMQKLAVGEIEGLKINKNLTVYTQMPDTEEEFDLENALATLIKNYSVVLIDTDFDTNNLIFEKIQELYLVQTMDVLTVQPLTAFLRNLKSKGILKPEKLKVVINKAMRVRSLSAKTLIGGISCYNSPNMSYMTELFNKDTIQYCEIPFETQNYIKYLDSLVNCSISLNGYTKQFISALKELANIVYPLVGKQGGYSPMNGKKGYGDPFSSQVNDTLNKMKSNY